MKKNNKGFSLVELIVVVLIMAIIAVALAPQVMKWVENSRKSTDCTNYDTLYQACGVALTDKDIYADIYGVNDVVLTMAGNNSTDKWQASGNSNVALTAGNAFYDNIKAQLGDKWEENLRAKASVLDYITPSGTQLSGSYIITIKKDGTVERTQAPDDKKIS